MLGWSRSDGGAVEPWSIDIAGLQLGLRPTDTGQVGLFPEHASTLGWLMGQVGSRTGDEAPSVLHLFAYTGLATLAMARAGAAVAHVDASRPTVAWARENAARNDLASAPIRWLVEDAGAFVAREARRGRRYAGIVLDPPSYGHGGRGSRPWRIDVDLPALLAASRDLLADDGFVLLTAHSEGHGPAGLEAALRATWGREGRPIEAGELALTSEAGGRLDLGAYARWDRRR